MTSETFSERSNHGRTAGGLNWWRIAPVLLTTAIVVEILVAVWWWALVGMSKEVGNAHFVTILVLAFGAIGASAYSHNDD